MFRETARSALFIRVYAENPGSGTDVCDV